MIHLTLLTLRVDLHRGMESQFIFGVDAGCNWREALEHQLDTHARAVNTWRWGRGLRPLTGVPLRHEAYLCWLAGELGTAGMRRLLRTHYGVQPVKTAAPRTWPCSDTRAKPRAMALQLHRAMLQTR